MKLKILFFVFAATFMFSFHNVSAQTFVVHTVKTEKWQVIPNAYGNGKAFENIFEAMDVNEQALIDGSKAVYVESYPSVAEGDREFARLTALVVKSAIIVNVGFAKEFMFRTSVKDEPYDGDGKEGYYTVTVEIR